MSREHKKFLFFKIKGENLLSVKVLHHFIFFFRQNFSQVELQFVKTGSHTEFKTVQGATKL